MKFEQRTEANEKETPKNLGKDAIRKCCVIWAYPFQPEFQKCGVSIMFEKKRGIPKEPKN